jgi:cellulose synthase/poly-beta-1,6-N-acetylglucosamine synthase-like glycosyltransferase
MGIIVLFILATLAQLLFWLGLFRRLARRRELASGVSGFPFLSVVVCARNEARNLAERLLAVLEQNYPIFEVIAVDHASADDTPAVLERLAEAYPRLRILRCDDPRPGKRAALRMGVEAARGEWLALTDADCRPGPDWLRTLAACMDEKAEVILGYGPLEKEPGFLNAFARFETAMTATQYFSYALAGIPYMGVGRNLAYRKSALPASILDERADIISGDDDLTVNAIANGKNTRVALSPGGFTWSAGPASWADFYRRKSRHMGSGRQYKPLHQFLLGAWALGLMGHYFFGILACLSGSWAVFLAGFALRQLVIGVLAGPLSRRLGVEDLRWKWAVFDFSLFLYYLIMSPSAWLPPRKKWG